MANAALKEARERKYKPISVYVLNASGRTVVSKTMLGVPSMPQELAHAKAQLCVSVHSSSRAMRDKYLGRGEEGKSQLLVMTTIGSAANQPLAAVPGGVLCRDSDKNVVAAVGVSGAAADEDEHCAITAALAVGLVTEPAVSPLGV
jgi:uncharacterized protein GlcG (DUF336 family)